jgi:prepilin-type N-terminal cleavage/methylation domain-containing protein
MEMISLSFRLKGEILQPMIVHKIPRLFASRNDTKHIFSKVSINQKGFTLIEIIASIVVMTIIAVIAGVGLVEISKGYVFSKKNALTTQQGQIVMARLKKEISNIMSVSSVTLTPPSITYTRSSETPPRPSHTISWVGGSSPLLVDGDTLVSPVTSFNLAYYEFNPTSSDPFKFTNLSYSSNTSVIEIILQLRGAENSLMNFTDRVNLYLETGG